MTQSDGLSPLARGTPRTASQPVRPVRFIPAGAGNTARWLPTTGQPSVYPRWRGEHVLIAVVTVGICGLSPLARGTPHQNPPENAHPRFIPAGAGNTDFDVEKIRTSAVYPRWRGEHERVGYRPELEDGLSPLARGTHLFPHPVIYLQRFIPAGAGNTWRGRREILTTAVYPRWRGEHQERDTPKASAIGLSPLARGTPTFRRILVPSRRFIPAGAGNTMAQIQLIKISAVYPRWRGEHYLYDLDVGFATGLSPLARGTLPAGAAYRALCRFIPAGAGNTGRTALYAEIEPVYPRWRGEHPHITAAMKEFGGLSPLARGTPL